MVTARERPLTPYRAVDACFFGGDSPPPPFFEAQEPDWSSLDLPSALIPRFYGQLVSHHMPCRWPLPPRGEGFPLYYSLCPLPPQILDPFILELIPVLDQAMRLSPGPTSGGGDHTSPPHHPSRALPPGPRAPVAPKEVQGLEDNAAALIRTQGPAPPPSVVTDGRTPPPW